MVFNSILINLEFCWYFTSDKTGHMKFVCLYIYIYICIYIYIYKNFEIKCPSTSSVCAQVQTQTTCTNTPASLCAWKLPKLLPVFRWRLFDCQRDEDRRVSGSASIDMRRPLQEGPRTWNGSHTGTQLALWIMMRVLGPEFIKELANSVFFVASSASVCCTACESAGD